MRLALAHAVASYAFWLLFLLWAYIKADGRVDWGWVDLVLFMAAPVTSLGFCCLVTVMLLFHESPGAANVVLAWCAFIVCWCSAWIAVRSKQGI